MPETETDTEIEYPAEIHVEGRRWFDRTYGNTYHTTRIFVNGEPVGLTPFRYGYDEQYVESAREWLVENEIIPEVKYPNGYVMTLSRTCEALGIKFSHTVSDGLKRELHRRDRDYVVDGERG